MSREWLLAAADYIDPQADGMTPTEWVDYLQRERDAISRREDVLRQECMALDRAYNAVLRERDDIRREYALFKAANAMLDTDYAQAVRERDEARKALRALLDAEWPSGTDPRAQHPNRHVAEVWMRARSVLASQPEQEKP
jgi:hypothetical protein